MEYKYKAFISYNQNDRDSRVAGALHSRIESYTVPRKLRKNGEKKPGKVFRDQEELSASSDLKQHIQDALDESEFLIVICSPGAVASKWVCKEIAYFLEHHEKEKLLTVLTGGNGTDIYKALLPGMPEPLSLDLTGIPDEEIPRKLKERFLKLCAPLLGCEYDELVRREQKRQRRIFLGWLAGITTVAAVIIGILLWSNWQINARNQEILLRESEILTQEAMEALDEGDRYNAIVNAVSALPSPEQDRPYYAPAEQVLWSALDPFNTSDKNYVFYEIDCKQSTVVRDFCLSTDGTILITADDYYTVTGFDAATGENLWINKIDTWYINGTPTLRVCEEQGSILFFTPGVFASLSQKTGEILWTLDEWSNKNTFCLVSDEQNLVMYITVSDNKQDHTEQYILTICSSENGSIISQIPIITCQSYTSNTDYPQEVYFPSQYNSEAATCYLSPCGRYFLGTYTISLNNQVKRHYYLADLEEQTCRVIYSEKARSIYDTLYGMSYQEESNSLLVMCSSQDNSDNVIVQRISLDNLSCFWQTKIPWEYLDELHFLLDRDILVSSGRNLYNIDFNTGEIVHHTEMEDQIAAFSLLQDGSFSYLLKNGYHAVGWWSGMDFLDSSRFSSSFINLGSCSKATLRNGGNIRLIQKNGSYSDFEISDDCIEGSCTVIIPQEDPHCVRILRPKKVPPILVKAQLHNSEQLSFELQQCCSEHLILFNIEQDYHYKCIVLDSRTLLVEAEYTLPQLYIDSEILFLPDGSGFIHQQLGKIIYVDLLNNEKVYLTDSINSSYETIKDNLSQLGLSELSVRLHKGNDVMSVSATINGLHIWINGKYSAEIKYPCTPEWIKQLNNITIKAGANGFVLLACDSDSDDSCFLICDVFGKRWYQIPVEKGVEISNYYWIGENSPIFLMLGDDGTVWIYDICTKVLKNSFQIGNRIETIMAIAFCCSDTILTVRTKDDDIMLFDIATGDLRCQTEVSWFGTGSLVCWEDEENGYLFITNGLTFCEGLCLSTEGLHILTRIPWLQAGTESVGRVFYRDIYRTKALITASLPTTEELVELGKQFIGE